MAGQAIRKEHSFLCKCNSPAVNQNLKICVFMFQTFDLWPCSVTKCSLTIIICFFFNCRSRRSWIQHHIQRCPHWWQRSHLCQKHPSSRGCHQRWSTESWRPAAGGGAALLNHLEPLFSIQSECALGDCMFFKDKLLSLPDRALFLNMILQSLRWMIQTLCIPYGYTKCG